MAQTINTNIASLNAQRNLAANQKDAATAMQRLSSGLRINSAKDDAAGLAISNRLTSQINGLNQAVRNANDGISVVRVAEGALAETTSILQRMRELSVQAANASYSDNDRSKIQTEIAQLTSEVERIASSTGFGDTKLLSGTFQNKSFQVGANAGEVIDITIGAAGKGDLGQLNLVKFGSNGASFESAQAIKATTSNIKAQTLTFTVDGTDTDVKVEAKDSARTIAANVSSQVGNLQASAVTKVVIDNYDSISASTAANRGEIVQIEVNGVALQYGSSGTDLTAATFATGLRDAINQSADLAGLSAVAINTASSDTTTGVIITDADGDNISVKLTGIFKGGTVNAADDDTIDINSAFSTGDDNDTPVYSDATLSKEANITAGDTVVVTGAVNFTTSLDVDKKVKVVGTEASAGAGAIATTTGFEDSVEAGTDFLKDVDVSTAAGANNALGIIDAAIAQVDKSRASLGAINSRLDSVVSNLMNVSENSSAARSRIMDADFAAETAQLAKTQILQQAGISVLAQANAQPQNILALLQ